MTDDKILDSFDRLRQYCEREGFRGWDPYDGLNSRVFKAIPGLKNSALCRLAVIQGFKRMPWNLRRIALVPKGYNAKGIGLFVDGYSNLLRAVVEHPELEKFFGTRDDLTAQVDTLAELLISMQSPGYGGACWGYNFDWQARRMFCFPAGTPTVVATTFCATALINAYEAIGRQRYLDVALTSADFVLRDLHRTPVDSQGHFLFSYSPLEGHNTVYNASLLGSRLLSYCYKYTGRADCFDAAQASVVACCEGQRPDGAWPYGMLPVQQWVDSFHTGYNLDAICDYSRLTGDHDFDPWWERGFKYYIEHFFEADGTPRYYDNNTWPIDIHAPAQLLVTLARADRLREHAALARRMTDWTIDHMQDRRGYFYYQIKRGISSHIPYMRWSCAFMFDALTYYLPGLLASSNALQ